MITSNNKRKKLLKLPIFNVQGVMFDAELIPHIEKAEKGDFDSSRLLAECFLFGDDDHPLRLYKSGVVVKKNTDIARYFSQKVLNVIKIDFTVTPKIQVRELLIMAQIEAEAGYYEDSKKYYMKAINFMTKKIPPEEWDFNIFMLFRYTMYHFQIITEEQYEFNLIK